MRRNLPQPLRLKQIIGPSFILLGLALGSGELIFWPYLVSRWGLGLLWGAVLGITLQFLFNMEVIRYTLCWGESIFVGFWRLWRWWPVWFILSTFIPWSLPGFSSGAAEILVKLTGGEESFALAVFLLFFVGLILTWGRTLYRTMEVFQRTIILLGFIFIVFLVLFFTGSREWSLLFQGLVGKGEGWWFFPVGMVWANFLAAVAYSGAGGNLNLAQSYYVKEKGLGMGKFSLKISSLFRGGAKETRLTGEIFPENELNRRRFWGWWRLVQKEHLIVFWFLGLVTIIFLSLLAYSLVFGRADAQGINFLYQEAAVIGQRLGEWGRVVFLLVAAGMLYSTQVGILESSARIISENILLVFYRPGKKVNPSLFFYLALWGEIILGMVLLFLGVQEPRFLLTLSAVLNALAMVVSFPLVWWLNQRRLPSFAQPRGLRKVFYWMGFVFLAFFALVVLKESFFDWLSPH